jgi:hypothetical protein
MPLMCRIKPRITTLYDDWISKEEFDELGPDYIRKELIPEDYLSFLEQVDLMSHVEFFWVGEK